MQSISLFTYKACVENVQKNVDGENCSIYLKMQEETSGLHSETVSFVFFHDLVKHGTK